MTALLVMLIVASLLGMLTGYPVLQTLGIVAAATSVSLTLGISGGLFLSGWSAQGGMKTRLAGVLDDLVRIPPLCFAVSAIALCEWAGVQDGWVIYGLSLTVALLPRVTLHVVREGQRMHADTIWAATSLGASRFQTDLYVVLPRTWRRLVAFGLRAAAWGSGEAAVAWLILSKGHQVNVLSLSFISAWSFGEVAVLSGLMLMLTTSLLGLSRLMGEP